MSFLADKKNDARVVNDLATELTRIRALHGAFNSAHEAYGVIAEELAEFFDEVRLKRADRSPDRMRSELIQIAAAACRAASDLGGTPQ